MVRRRKRHYALVMWKRIFYVMLAMTGLSFLLTYTGNVEQLGLIDDIGLWLITSFFLTGIIQIIMQHLTGNLLEKRIFTLRFGKKRYPITLFLIVSILLSMYFFGVRTPWS